MGDTGRGQLWSLVVGTGLVLLAAASLYGKEGHAAGPPSPRTAVAQAAAEVMLPETPVFSVFPGVESRDLAPRYYYFFVDHPRQAALGAYLYLDREPGERVEAAFIRSLEEEQEHLALIEEVNVKREAAGLPPVAVVDLRWIAAEGENPS